jgi:hypothetical protein
MKSGLFQRALEIERLFREAVLVEMEEARFGAVGVAL